MIEVRRLSVIYKNARSDFTAVKDFDLSLRKGEICALLGPSGCGKTTVLYVLAGILKDYAGQAHISEKPVDPKKLRIGLVPQNYGLLDWATVYQNAALGLKIKRDRERGNKERIDRILDMTGLSGLEIRYPGQLSSGQRQRVSIARAFILMPDVLLMDEPFSSLDAITREDMQRLFLSVWQEYCVSTLFVTHSIEEAVFVGKKIAVMSPSPGRIVSIIENPLFGQSSLRFSDKYYRFIMDIRGVAKEVWQC